MLELPTFILALSFIYALSSPFLALFVLGVLGFLILASMGITHTRGHISKKLRWNDSDEKMYILFSWSTLFWIPAFTYLMIFYLAEIMDLTVFSFSKVLMDPFNLSSSYFGLEKIFSAWWYFGLIIPLLLVPILYFRHKLLKNDVTPH